MATATKERSSSASASSVVVSPGYCPTPGAATTTAGSFLMLPRCTLKVEKIKGGCKIHCGCDDQVACNMLQNLCRILEGGVCGFSCLLNGQCVCTCSLSCGHCSCELTKDGCTLTCTSGDAK